MACVLLPLMELMQGSVEIFAGKGGDETSRLSGSLHVGMCFDGNRDLIYMS